MIAGNSVQQHPLLLLLRACNKGCVVSAEGDTTIVIRGPNYNIKMFIGTEKSYFRVAFKKSPSHLQLTIRGTNKNIALLEIIEKVDKYNLIR